MAVGGGAEGAAELEGTALCVEVGVADAPGAVAVGLNWELGVLAVAGVLVALGLRLPAGIDGEPAQELIGVHAPMTGSPVPSIGPTTADEAPTIRVTLTSPATTAGA